MALETAGKGLQEWTDQQGHALLFANHGAQRTAQYRSQTRSEEAHMIDLDEDFEPAGQRFLFPVPRFDLTAHRGFPDKQTRRFTLLFTFH